MQQPKLPPHSNEAEQSVIGGLIVDNRAWADVSDMLVEQDFYFEHHRVLWRAIGALCDSSKPCDIVTVPDWLRDRDLLSSVGAEYVGGLAVDVPSAANIRGYAQVVQDKSMRRALIKAGSDMESSAYADDGVPTQEKLEAAEQSVSAISQQREVDSVVTSREAARLSIDRIERRLSADGDVTGTSSGFADYDRMTTGLQPGELIILAARPSMGKSAFAMQAAYSIARAGKQVLCYSLEMPPEDLNDRQLAALSGVPLERIRSPKLLGDEDWNALTPAIREVNEIPLSIVDNAGITMRSVKAIARRNHRKKPVGLIVVDYLQQVVADDSKKRRDEQLSAMTSGLKQLARELKCPVICLSQLNRQVEQREDKRPRMSDLRESGGIEQDADVIAFLYRDEVYNENSPHEGIAEMIFSKQRNGPIGSIDLAWDKNCVRFRDYTGPSKSEREPEKQSGRKKARGFSYDEGF